MRIEKVINNNIIQSRDSKGVELVVMGRGIGFGKGPGSEIDSASIEKVFKLDNMDDKEHFKELIASFPFKYIRLANEIISYARESLEITLNQNVYLTLTDHISFAIDRYQAGMNFSNILSDEVRLFYPVEYSVGRYALELIEERTGCRLPEDEAASVALHIVNGETNLVMGHKDEALYRFVEENYRDEYQIINGINEYIEEHYQCSMTEEEKIYLALNIKRMKDLYAG